jgi:hypothetical protein
VMMKPVKPTPNSSDVTHFSELSGAAFDDALAACKALADGFYAGLDLSREILTVSERGLGDTLIVYDQGTPVGFAICHFGAGSEASSARLLVKFALIKQTGEGGEIYFRSLLAACESLAAQLGAPEIAAGANAGRSRAYGLMKEAGFRTTMNGVIMMRPDQPGYNRADSLVIDDWR